VRTAILPYKEHDSDPEWSERVVHRPESWLDWLRLCFVRGRWHDHRWFGLLRVEGATARDKKQPGPFAVTG